MKGNLLLGNGINRAFTSESWSEFIRKIWNYYHYGRRVIDFRNMPFNYQIVLASCNNVRSALDLFSDNFNRPFSEGNEDQIALYQDILSIGFHNIYTANYTYELEAAANVKKNFTADRAYLTNIGCYRPLKLLGREYMDSSETRKYGFRVRERSCFQFRCCEVKFNDIRNTIWHIHGEARYLLSMVMSVDYYARLTSRNDSALSITRQVKRDFPLVDIKEISWLVSFIEEDVYVLGFGFDYSEIDMWTLLTLKNERKGSRVYYYVPVIDGNIEDPEKIELLRCYDVVKIVKIEVDNYIEFYRSALRNISWRMRQTEGTAN